jgi:cyclophilin family peptidyl-prolyl cis-trans isomerase
MRLFIAFIVLLLVFGCVANQPVDQTNGSNHTNPAPANVSPALPAKEIVVLETSKGTIEIELDRAHAPATVDNFEAYVKAGFYDGLVFHRVIRGFMIQGGGFDSQAIESQTRAPIKNEASNGLKNIAGTISMARTDLPDSATSQFFINTKDNAFLDYSGGNPGYAVFGKVISGMDVVHAIENVTVHDFGYYGDWPDEAVVIKKAYMKGG